MQSQIHKTLDYQKKNRRKEMGFVQSKNLKEGRRRMKPASFFWCGPSLMRLRSFCSQAPLLLLSKPTKFYSKNEERSAQSSAGRGRERERERDD